MLVSSFPKWSRKPTQVNRCSSDGHSLDILVSLFVQICQTRREGHGETARKSHMTPFLPAMKVNIWWQKRSTSTCTLFCTKQARQRSLSELMKGTGPVRLLMGHTSWKCSANSFCKKRKL